MHILASEGSSIGGKHACSHGKRASQEEREPGIYKDIRFYIQGFWYCACFSLYNLHFYSSSFHKFVNTLLPNFG